MTPNRDFLNLDPEFWANVKLLNQRLGYTIRKSKSNPEGGFVVPSPNQIKQVFIDEGLNYSKLVKGDELTEFGQQLTTYMSYRGGVLTKHVKKHLLNQDEAHKLFYDMRVRLKPTCPLPENKQSGNKKDYAFLTGMVNMLTWEAIKDIPCDYDPSELTAITDDKFPVRTLSRRVDGAFPSVIDPLAIWEIKEYYYTTTFGSRVADGVYETQLDGWELWEARQKLDKHIRHYLIIDAYYTWWDKGRSYLCRLIDTMHMGLVDEVIFGREVIERWPIIMEELLAEYQPPEETEPKLF